MAYNGDVSLRRNIICIAHRGYSSKYPECTELAYRKAIELNVDFVEYDIMRTKDGHFVIFHAGDLSDVSDGGGPIRDVTLEEVRQFNVSAGFGEKYGFQPILTLEEGLQIARDFGVRVCAEMKFLETSPELNSEDLIVPYFAKYELMGHVVFNSTHDPFLKACHEKYPVIPLALDLAGGETDVDGFIQRALQNGIQIIQYDYRHMSPEIVRELKCHGLAVWAWTINDRDDMLQAIDWGVDGILTDDPGTLCEVLGQSAGA
jgi:glycerophosphoryl diester phosphodiesterase